MTNIDEFRASLDGTAPPPSSNELLQALWHDAKGDWTRAHEITQAASGTPAARVHAYLHRKEGDLDNAGYWHRRAGSTMPAVTLEQEWDMLVSDLLNKGSR
jgi:hypothetical protein